MLWIGREHTGLITEFRTELGFFAHKQMHFNLQVDYRSSPGLQLLDAPLADLSMSRSLCSMRLETPWCAARRLNRRTMVYRQRTWLAGDARFSLSINVRRTARVQTKDSVDGSIFFFYINIHAVYRLLTPRCGFPCLTGLAEAPERNRLSSSLRDIKTCASRVYVCE